jgi:hypothetical protein
MTDGEGEQGDETEDRDEQLSHRRAQRLSSARSNSLRASG